LLHIQPGGSVPEHTHNGFELTVLIAGDFSDDQGEYVPGDFIMLDKKHQHHPVSEKGCLCFTVANDSLHFTQGINKLLNPIGTFIY
jgi:putative transcriptional regulator